MWYLQGNSFSTSRVPSFWPKKLKIIGNSKHSRCRKYIFQLLLLKPKEENVVAWDFDSLCWRMSLFCLWLSEWVGCTLGLLSGTVLRTMLHKLFSAAVLSIIWTMLSNSVTDIKGTAELSVSPEHYVLWIFESNTAWFVLLKQQSLIQQISDLS